MLKIQAETDSQPTWCHEAIDRQVTHMTKLLDDLLDVARIMQGKIALKTERVDIAERCGRNQSPSDRNASADLDHFTTYYAAMAGS